MKFLSTLLLLFMTLGNMAQEIELDDTPRITTKGSATVYAVPDEILINFSIITADDDISKVRQMNRDESASVIAYLKKAGVQDKHIQTQWMRVGKRYRHSQAEGHGKFEASQSFNVCITQIDKFEDIMAGLLVKGVDNIGGPTFRSTTIREHKDEARKKAIKAAKEKAEMLAKELGQSIGQAIIISEGGANNFNQRNAYANVSMDAEMGGGNQGPGFALGQMEIRAEITVSFQLF